MFAGMEISSRDIDEYLASLPEEVRGDMTGLDRVIAGAMEGLPRELYVGKFWGGSDQTIIGYGRLSYSRSDGKGVEWFMVGLALQKHYISVYMSAVDDGEYVAEKHGKSLGKVKVGKSSISFAGVDDIDVDRLADLVGRARELLTVP
jgi:hypothetical protein